MLSAGFVAPIAEPHITLGATATASALNERSNSSHSRRNARTVAPSARSKPVKAKPVKSKPATAAKVKSAIALPVRAEPLVERSRAVVVYREGGLLGPLGQ